MYFDEASAILDPYEMMVMVIAEESQWVLGHVIEG